MPIIPIQKPRIPILLAGWWPNKLPFKRGARWDGIMPYWNSLPKELKEEDLRATVDYYKEVAASPGEIVVPYYNDITDEFIGLCEEIDVTWILASGLMKKDVDTMEKIREGPPKIQ